MMKTVEINGVSALIHEFKSRVIFTSTTTSTTSMSNNRNNTTSSTATVPVSAVKCHINEMNIKNTADIDMSTSSSYVPITEAVVLTRGGTGAIEMDYFNDELIEINPIFFDPFLFTNNNSTHSQKHSVSSPATDTHKYK